MNSAAFFNKIKNKKAPSHMIKQVAAVPYFQLRTDDKGAYICVVDQKGREIDPEYEYYNGYERNVLKAVKNIREQNSFKISWDNSQNAVYLGENEFLIWQLKHCSNFVDEEFKPVQFQEQMASIIVTIEEREEILYSLVTLHTVTGDIYREFFFLNENHVLVDGKIFPVHPVSDNFAELLHFSTPLFPADLEKFLAILFSYFDNITVRYKDFRQEKGEPRNTVPTLVFEQVDAQNSLFLRITSTLAGFDIELLNDFDINRVVTVNEVERKLIISDVIHEPLYNCYNEIEKLLKKYKRQAGDSHFFTEDNIFIIEEKLARLFLFNELSYCISAYAVYGAEKLKSYKIRAFTPRLRFSISHGIDFLSGDASLDFDGQVMSLFDVLTQYKSTSYVTLSDGTIAVLNKDFMVRLQRIFKKDKDKTRVSFFDLPIVEELINEKIDHEAFTRSREIFSGFNRLAETEVIYPVLNGELRTYQQLGYKWLAYLHRHSLGGCLADDMGLGKTIQAIALLSSLYPGEKQPSLVIMPRSLLFNWENEIRKFNSKLTTCIYYGQGRDLKKAGKHHLILTTYGTVRVDIQVLKEKEFCYIILDESQNIKNINSQNTKAAMLLKARYRLALSGTPVENNLGELYSLFRFLIPSLFGSLDDFNRYYATPIQKNGDKGVLEELRRRIYPFILRRLKKDVAADLPDKIEQVLYVDMNPKQKFFYEQRRQFYYQMVKSQISGRGIRKSQFFILQALSELRQIASVPEAKMEEKIIAPKRKMLLENLMDAVANGHKILVFANFLAVINLISADLEKNGIEHLIMTGAIHDRKTLVEKFQNDERYRVFLMTLKTGGTGLNLTRADYIFIFDPWWNRAAENQAIDRTHRIGQDKTVFSYRLITRNTIEEKILKLQEIKKELFESLISADNASIKSLSEEDVDYVLGE